MVWCVGQKVTPIRDGWKPVNGVTVTPGFPQKGEIYTIREIVTAKFYAGPARAALRLQEIICGSQFDGPEFAFDAAEYRPVVERKTDIIIFEALLNPANHKQLELT